MTFVSRPALTLVVFTALAVAASAARSQAEVPDASPAERLVFLNPHLSNMKAPSKLHYEFVRRDPLQTGGPSTDKVDLTLGRGKTSACCTVKASFLSGARAMNLPEVDDARANPVVMYMLEYDVRQLERSYPGKSAYFRKRIRLAFVDAATVSPTTVRWNGRDVEASTVQISPFLNDPNRARFERESKMVYTFVLSDAVPGGVYQIKSLLPGETPGTPVFEETLTLDSTP